MTRPTCSERIEDLLVRATVWLVLKALAIWERLTKDPDDE